MKRIALQLLFLFFSLFAYAQAPVIEWERSWGERNGLPRRIIQTSDKGYLLMGESRFSEGNVINKGQQDGFLVRFDSLYNVKWMTSIGSTEWDGIADGVQTEDGSFLLVGQVRGTGGDVTIPVKGQIDSWIVRVNDIDGAIEYQYIMGGSGNDYLDCIIKTSDGNYLLGGYTSSNDGDLEEVKANDDVRNKWLVKLNSELKLVWQRTYGGVRKANFDETEAISDILEDPKSGEYTLLGSESSVVDGFGKSDIWLAQVRADNGDILWEKKIGGAGIDHGKRFYPTEDGGYMLFAQSNSADAMSFPKGGGGLDFWVIKLNNEREIEWDYSYGTITGEYLYDVCVSEDKGYVMTGNWQGPAPANANNVYVVKIDNEGVEQWSMQYGGAYAMGWSVTQANDGGFLLVDNQDSKFRVVKLSACPAQVAITEEICIGDTLEYNGKLYTEAGVYYDTLASDSKCPHYVELTILVHSLPEPVISQEGNTLNTGEFAGYEWLLNEMPLSYAANRPSFSVEATGHYQLVVTDTNGCKNSAISFDFLYSGCEAPPVMWNKVYGGSLADQAYSVVPVAEGGFLVTGRTNSQDGDVNGLHGTSYDLWLVRVNDHGDTLWTRTYGGGGNEYMYDMIVTSDGGFALVGESATNAVAGDVTADRPSSSSGRDLWVLKLNGNGDIEWQRLYGGSNIDIGYGIAETSDGYILCGALHNSSSGGTLGDHASNGGYDGWMLKLDDEGNLVWQKRLGGGGADYLYSVVSTSDGGYTAIGYSATNAGAGTLGETLRPAEDSGSDIWIIKLDASGETVWQHLYGGSGTDIAYALALTPDGYIVSGYSASSDGTFEGKPKPGGNDAALLRLSSDGSLIWSGLYGGSADDRSVSYDVLVEEDGYVLTGYSASVDGDVTGNKGNTDIWVLKADLSGSFVWQRSLGGKGADQAYSIVPAAESGYVIAGYATDIEGGKGVSDYFFIKMNTCVTCTEASFVSICENKTYEFNGESISAQGVYTRDVPGEEGCTQIEGLKLSHLPAYTVVQDASICAGETFEFYDQSLAESGSYIHVLRSEAGCDSTISLRFVVHELPVPEIMGDENNTLVTGQYAGYKWFYNNADLGSEDNNVQAEQTGYYRVAVTDGNGCSDTSNALFVGISILDAFDLEGRYVWKFSIPGMGDQVSAQEYYADRIDYRMTGNAYANDYSMTMESYDGEEGRWIGVGSGGTSITKDGIYYVLFFREYRGDSVLVYKHECVSREEAYTFVYPAEDAVSDYGWNWYVRDAGTGLYNFQGTTLVNLYPNPVQSMLQVVHPFKGSVSIHLYDAYGRLVNTSSDQTSIDMSACSSGVYLLQVYENNTLQYTERIIKR